MSQQVTPASGREDHGLPRPRIGGNTFLAEDRGTGLGVRPGESNPARMLSGVLVLTIAMIIMAVALVWWLA